MTRTSLPKRWKARMKMMALLSLLFAMALVYALAVDPKSRMFLLPACTATLCLAASLVTAWRDGRRLLVIVIVAVLAIVGVATLRAKTDLRPFERAARTWIAGYGSKIEIDQPTQTALALVPEARRLPLRGAGRPLRLSIGLGGCERLVTPSPAKPSLARIIGAAGPPGHDQLCLLEYTAAGRAGLARPQS
jgi:4-amino-4-deoxy-L-arabinose transferase-like glycosyltransferase